MFSRPKTCIYHIKAVSCEPYKFCGEYLIYSPHILRRIRHLYSANIIIFLGVEYIEIQKYPFTRSG